DLAAEQHIPQHDGAQENSAGLRKEIRPRHQEHLDEAPKDHLHDRPITEIEKTRPGSRDQIPMAQHHRADAPRRARVDESHASLPRAPWRTTSRNTSSSVGRPYFAINSLGAPESTMRPAFIIRT